MRSTEAVEFTNMCMIRDGDRVLVQDRLDPAWPGAAFPGGHVETGESFTDVVAEAISIGGDSDTIAAIAGSMAEVVYPIPTALKQRVAERLDDFLLQTLTDAAEFAEERKAK